MAITDRDFLIQLGKSIKKLRKLSGYTQADLAYKINMEVPNLSVIENGKSNPQILTLLKIAAALDTSLDKLIPLMDEPQQFLESKAEYTPRKHRRKEDKSTGHSETQSTK